MRKLKVLISCVCILTTMFTLCACSSEDEKMRKEYESLKEESNVKIGNSDTTTEQSEIEKTLTEFIQLVYNPNSQEDMDAGIELIKEYCTETEYNELKESVVYDSNKKADIDSVKINLMTDSSTEIIGKKEVVNIDRSYINSMGNTAKESTLIEFYINGKGLIYKHSIWNKTK